MGYCYDITYREAFLPLGFDRKLDVAACGLSLACLVHCLALPLAASLLPVLNLAAHAEWIHWAFFLVAAPIAGLALLRPGVSPYALYLASAGVLLLLAGAANVPSVSWGTPLSVAGALMLAMGHTINALLRLNGAQSRLNK